MLDHKFNPGDRVRLTAEGRRNFFDRYYMLTVDGREGFVIRKYGTPADYGTMPVVDIEGHGPFREKWFELVSGPW